MNQLEQTDREIVGTRAEYGEGISLRVCPADEDDARAVWFPPMLGSEIVDPEDNAEYQLLTTIDTEPYLKFGRLSVESIAVKHHADKDHLLLKIQRKSGRSQLLSLAYTEQGNLTLIAYAGTADITRIFDTEEIGEIKLD